MLLHQGLVVPFSRYTRLQQLPFFRYTPQQQLTPGLLRANKTIHDEASSLFYGRNSFAFADVAPEEIITLLEQIGSNNAGYIQHILIDFPEFFHLDPEDVTLEDGSISILTTIQGRCVNLRTLTTSLYSTNAMELRLDDLDNHKVATKALELVDTRFRDISSLQEIILEVYKDGPSDYIRREMEGHGWTIRTTEYVEEDPEPDWDGGLSDFDDDYNYSQGDDDDADDYDIDNDSDFWRRAAD